MKRVLLSKLFPVNEQCDTTALDMQDVVTREGKLLCLYKRPGHRVIIDAKGRLIVRPTHMEASVQRNTAGMKGIMPDMCAAAQPLHADSFPCLRFFSSHTFSIVHQM